MLRKERKTSFTHNSEGTSIKCMRKLQTLIHRKTDMRMTHPSFFSSGKHVKITVWDSHNITDEVDRDFVEKCQSMPLNSVTSKSLP